MAIHPAKVDVPLYLKEKRARKHERRKHREWKVKSERQASAAALQKEFGKVSRIVEMLAGDRPESAKEQNKNAKFGTVGGRLRFTLPPTFSIIDDPVRTLAAVRELASQMRAKRLGSLFLDFGKVTQYDLGANALLDVLVDELSTQAKQTGRIIRWQGKYPADPAHMRFIRSMGVIKRLKIAHEYPSKEDEVRLRVFDARCKHYIRALRPREADKNARVTAAFADHIDTCLLTIGRKLTETAKLRLCLYVGEIIDNAEEHSRMFDWAIQGYLDTQLDVPMCEVVIFNFGRTIAETFDALPSKSYARLHVQKYIDLHQRAGMFRRGWRREDLYTLVALQGCVSTKNNSPSDTRGNGTVDLITFFEQMHSECRALQSPGAKMVILSGSTYALFDGTFHMAPNAEGNRIIAFNAVNDLRMRPDERFVRHLSGVNFPGTLISLKFPLSTSKSTEAATGDEP